MNKTTKKSTETNAAPTVYRYYDENGKLLSQVAVGDTDVYGKTVTAEHIAALYETDAEFRRQKWLDDKHIRKGNPINPKTGEAVPEDKDAAFATWDTPETMLFSEDEIASFFGDLVDKLPAAIARLQPQQRELIQQFFFERRTQKEIADAAGVTDAAVRNRLTKLKVQLRKTLEN